MLGAAGILLWEKIRQMVEFHHHQLSLCLADVMWMQACQKNWWGPGGPFYITDIFRYLGAHTLSSEFCWVGSAAQPDLGKPGHCPCIKLYCPIMCMGAAWVGDVACPAFAQASAKVSYATEWGRLFECNFSSISQYLWPKLILENQPFRRAWNN